MISPSPSAVGEQPLEEVLRRDLALVGRDRRAESQQRGGIVGGRVVVGDRAADGAAVPDVLVADAGGHVDEAGDRAAHDR